MPVKRAAGFLMVRIKGKAFLLSWGFLAGKISSVNVEPPRLDHETIDRINRMWDSLTVEQKMPYQDKALPKSTQQTGRYLVPGIIGAAGI
jgi:hypothetical protein